SPEHDGDRGKFSRLPAVLGGSHPNTPVRPKRAGVPPFRATNSRWRTPRDGPERLPHWRRSGRVCSNLQSMRRLARPLLALLVCAVPGISRAGSILPALPGEVRGGESVEVRWRAVAAEVHEVELELSLDGGRWVRISPELEPHEGRFVWRAPVVA